MTENEIISSVTKLVKLVLLPKYSDIKRFKVKSTDYDNTFLVTFFIDTTDPDIEEKITEDFLSLKNYFSLENLVFLTDFIGTVDFES
jgi:hypothetical protein